MKIVIVKMNQTITLTLRRMESWSKKNVMKACKAKKKKTTVARVIVMMKRIMMTYLQMRMKTSPCR